MEEDGQETGDQILEKKYSTVDELAHIGTSDLYQRVKEKGLTDNA